VTLRTRKRVNRLAVLMNRRPVSSPLRRLDFFGGGGVSSRPANALAVCRNSRRIVPSAFGCCLLPRAVSPAARVLSVSLALSLARSLGVHAALRFGWRGVAENARQLGFLQLPR
jgi:hypothetical protein